MRESLAFVILLAGASSSFAQTSMPASGLTPAVQLKIAATTFILDEPTSYCTVSPITPDGYMLTALHCLRNCLLANNAAETGSNTFIGLNELFVSNRSRATNVVCKDVSIPALGIHEVTVVETGPALSQFDARFITAFPTLYAELKAHGFASRANDYAILKIKAAKPLPCLKISSVAAAGETPVWGIGYPLPSNNAQPVLSASSGRVYSSVRDSRAYAVDSAEERAFLDEVYSGAGVLYSSAPNEAGQSGGPVITADGTVVGVVSGYTMVTEKDKSEVHELVAVTSDSVLKALTPALAATLIQRTAFCQ